MSDAWPPELIEACAVDGDPQRLVIARLVLDAAVAWHDDDGRRFVIRESEGARAIAFWQQRAEAAERELREFHAMHVDDDDRVEVLTQALAAWLDAYGVAEAEAIAAGRARAVLAAPVAPPEKCPECGSTDWAVRFCRYGDGATCETGFRCTDQAGWHLAAAPVAPTPEPEPLESG